MSGRHIVRVNKRGAQGEPGDFDPFLMRMTPTVVTDFGFARSSTANLPTVTAMTDTDGRPFVRFRSTLDSGSKMFLLLDDVGAKLSASGRFRVEMRARWGAGLAAGQMAGIAFNCDRAGSLLTCYAVANHATDGDSFDSLTSGVADGHTVANAAGYNGSAPWTPLHVDAWLDVTTGYCSYAYGGFPDAISVDPAGYYIAKTSLVTPGESGIGIYTTGGVGYLDIAELTIWKNERSW